MKSDLQVCWRNEIQKSLFDGQFLLSLIPVDVKFKYNHVVQKCFQDYQIESKYQNVISMAN